MAVLHDVWSIDQYGDDFKVTYIKCLGEGGGAAERDTTPSDGRFYQSRWRSRAAVFELAMCNEFQYFVTLTVDGSLRDRYDVDGLVKALAQFVRNENRGRDDEAKIRYLFVPEQHRDGAWHLHGLMMGLQTKRDLFVNEHGYLDWIRYRSRFGFFSCSEIRDKRACAAYVAKYITKSFETPESGLSGRKHLYYASQGLKRKGRIVDKSKDVCPVTGGWDYENDYVMVKWIRGELVSETQSTRSVNFWRPP